MNAHQSGWLYPYASIEHSLSFVWSLSSHREASNTADTLIAAVCRGVPEGERHWAITSLFMLEKHCFLSGLPGLSVFLLDTLANSSGDMRHEVLSWTGKSKIPISEPPGFWEHLTDFPDFEKEMRPWTDLASWSGDCLLIE
jgi:hypothetical protein